MSRKQYRRTHVILVKITTQMKEFKTVINACINKMLICINKNNYMIELKGNWFWSFIYKKKSRFILILNFKFKNWTIKLFSDACERNGIAKRKSNDNMFCFQKEFYTTKLYINLYIHIYTCSANREKHILGFSQHEDCEPEIVFFYIWGRYFSIGKWCHSCTTW